MNSKIVVCSQNHVARRIAAKNPNVTLCASGVFTTVAVLISDGRDNVSLAHIDTKTNLDFIDDEIAFLTKQGAQECKVIFYIPNKFEDLRGQRTHPYGEQMEIQSDDLYFKVQTLIKQYYAEKYVGKEEPKFETMTSQVLMISPSNEISFPSMESIMVKYAVGEAQCSFYSCAAVQTQLYQRQLAVVFSKEKQKPTLTFDGQKFIAEEILLPSTIMNYIDGKKPEKEDNLTRFCRKKHINPDISERMSAMYVIPRYKERLQESQTHKAKGNQHFQAGNIKKAMECYVSALDLNPQFKEALYNMGQCFMALEKYENALLFFDKALAIDPHYKNARISKAQAEMKSQTPQTSGPCHK